MNQKTFQQQFWDKIQKTSSCWLWTGCLNSKGYGNLTLKKKNVKAHRLSWKIHHKKIPKNKHVLHKCDVRNCVNPKHLFIGTNYDNVKDCIKKDRNTKGEKTKQSHLTAKDIKNIRKKYIPYQHSSLKLAKEYNVYPCTILNIVKRKT